jgi:hypothetical protein
MGAVIVMEAGEDLSWCFGRIGKEGGKDRGKEACMCVVLAACSASLPSLACLIGLSCPHCPHWHA